MAKFVREIMNSEPFSVTLDTPAIQARGHIVALGVTGAPVIDSEGRSVGFVSLRDLVGELADEPVSQLMTSPALTVSVGTTIAQVARDMAERSLHHLVVVDDEDALVGVLSCLDVLRAMTGVPATHPPTFPHYDRQTGLIWTDANGLTLEEVLANAPDGPGVFTLIRDAFGAPESIMWVEEVENVASRLIDLVSSQQSAALARILDSTNLRFRAAAVDDPRHRREVYETLRQSLANWPGA